MAWLKCCLTWSACCAIKNTADKLAANYKRLSSTHRCSCATAASMSMAISVGWLGGTLCST